jgi:hypothetical protein
LYARDECPLHRLSWVSDYLFRQVFPAVCVAKPLPTVSRIEHGTVPAQQFHLAAAYSIVHGASNVGHEAGCKKKPGGSGPPDSSGGNAQRGHRTVTQPTLYQRG